MLRLTHPEILNMFAHSLFYLNATGYSGNLLKTIINIPVKCFLSKIVSVKNAYPNSASGSSKRNPTFAGPFSPALDSPYTETRPTMLSRLVQRCRRVKNRISESFSLLSSVKNFKDYKNSHPFDENRCRKYDKTVEAFHIRNIRDDILNKLYNGIDTDKKGFHEWKAQESKTYAGALINKEIDDFIAQSQGAEQHKKYADFYKKMQVKKTPREKWANDIYLALHPGTPSNHKNDIHMLANPTIYKAVFEYFYDTKRGDAGKEKSNDINFIWRISHQVYGGILKDSNSPEKIIKECQIHLRTLEPPTLSEPRLSPAPVA